MWPFSRKQEEKPKQSESEINAGKFLAWRKLGDSFVYLGVECMVCENHLYVLDGFGTRLSPGIKCNYVDKNGVIQTVCFGIREFETLKQMNKEEE